MVREPLRQAQQVSSATLSTSFSFFPAVWRERETAGGPNDQEKRFFTSKSSSERCEEGTCMPTLPTHLQSQSRVDSRSSHWALRHSQLHSVERTTPGLVGSELGYRILEQS